jgi:hypothetical protein
MAEIRSTMEMVLERAAKMSEGVADSNSSEEAGKKGMKLAARYLADEDVDFIRELESAGEDKGEMLKGMVNSLLRNIVLPREKESQTVAEKAMQGLITIGSSSPDLINIFSEMKSILDRYSGHKEQLRQQLEDNFRQQMGMMENNLAQQTGMDIKLEPSQHPKFAEEWQRLQTELNDQYGQAIDQHKNYIKQILTA